MSFVASYARTMAGAREVFVDDGLNIAPRYKSPRERVIELAASWNERHQPHETVKPRRACKAKPRFRPMTVPAHVPEQDTAEALRILSRCGMPGWAREIVIRIAKVRGVSPLDIASVCRTRRVVPVRNEIFYTLKTMPSPVTGREQSYPQIASWFGREHTGIMYGAVRHAAAHGLDRPGGFNLDGALDRRRVRALEYTRAKRGLR